MFGQRRRCLTSLNPKKPPGMVGIPGIDDRLSAGCFQKEGRFIEIPGTVKRQKVSGGEHVPAKRIRNATGLLQKLPCVFLALTQIQQRLQAQKPGREHPERQGRGDDQLRQTEATASAVIVMDPYNAKPPMSLWTPDAGR